jgi:hypothetical protein
MWSIFTPRLGIGLSFASGLQTVAANASGLNIEHI